MPLQVPKRKVSDTENRLRVLFCVDALGMATPEQLWPFVAEMELMEYLPFCLHVDELKRDGSLKSGVHALEGMLFLTAKGRESLALFSARMPRSDRERILVAAPDYRAMLHERHVARAAYERAPDGEYRLLCVMREDEVPTLMLRVQTPSKALAATVMKRFRRRAARLVRLLYALPCATDAEAPLPAFQSATTAEEGMTAATPTTPALCACGKHAHAAAVRLCDGETRYTLSLLLPGREAAQSWARSAMEQGDQLAARLTAAFTDEKEEAK